MGTGAIRWQFELQRQATQIAPPVDDAFDHDKRIGFAVAIDHEIAVLQQQLHAWSGILAGMAKSRKVAQEGNRRFQPVHLAVCGGDIVGSDVQPDIDEIRTRGVGIASANSHPADYASRLRPSALIAAKSSVPSV